MPLRWDSTVAGRKGKLAGLIGRYMDEREGEEEMERRSCGSVVNSSIANNGPNSVTNWTGKRRSREKSLFKSIELSFFFNISTQRGRGERILNDFLQFSSILSVKWF